jgi:membrane-bound metal-dependent hydrolase YbcI (DUF457 family)
MKGIAHFLSGVAVATCLPGAVEAAASGSYLFVLAGAAALLPDTLDFRLERYLERAGPVLGPERGAEALAREVAGAVALAASGRPQTVRLRAARVGPDRWQRYGLRFDPAGRWTEAWLGPLVTGGQVALPAGPPAAPARVALPAPIEYGYDAELSVDIFAGPSLRFEPAARCCGPYAGRLVRACAPHPVRVHFLPWHRARTHSLVLALAAGLLAGLLWGPPAGLAAGLGYAIHVLEDQLGLLGSNLFWPLTRSRTPGLGWLRSGDALPNVMTVWLALALILFNLARHGAGPGARPELWLALLGGLPALALGALYARRRGRGIEPRRG